jgi:nitrile hydratase
MSGGPHSTPRPDIAARALAMQALLVEKGLLTAEQTEEIAAAVARAADPPDTTPTLGARMVARAWVDPAYKQRLLDEPRAAAAELGFDGMMQDLVVLETTPQAHHLVVCTLCSCYPWTVLGLPPTWYKSPPYRSRAVLEPRRVLAELGLELPADVEVNVWDSTSDVRYLVLPERPAGTEGWSEAQLAELVTRDAMIGVAKVTPPLAPACGEAARG